MSSFTTTQSIKGTDPQSYNEQMYSIAIYTYTSRQDRLFREFSVLIG